MDTEGVALTWSNAPQLAERHGLSSYDASYLELAQRKVLPLATMDDALRRAAIVAGCGGLVTGTYGLHTQSHVTRKRW